MRSFTLVVLLGAGACASAEPGAPSPTPEHTRLGIDAVPGAEFTIRHSRSDVVGTVALPPERAWSELPAAYAAAGLGEGEVVEPGRVYRRRNLRVVRRLGDIPLGRIVDCGATLHGDATSYEIYLTATTTLRPTASGQTEVSTVVEATGRQIGSSNNTVQCTTRGEVEGRILRALQQRPPAA